MKENVTKQTQARDIVIAVYNRKLLLLIFVFFASILVSVVYLSFFQGIGPAEHAIPGTDYLKHYKPYAESILENGSFPVRGHLGAISAPGYPGFLAIIFSIARFLNIDEFSLIIIFNVLIAAGSSVLLFLIVSRIWTKRIALLTSLAWMTYPFGLWFLKNPHTEIPFIFFLYGAILTFLISMERRSLPYILLTGILLGIASLIRPIALLFPIVLLFGIFFMMKESAWKLRFLFAGVLLVAYVLTLLPWELHVFSETGGISLVADTNTSNVQQGLIFAAREGRAPISVPDSVWKLMQEIKAQDLDTISKIIHFSVGELSQRPVPFLELLSLKAARAWYATDRGWYEGQILLLQLLYLIPAALGFLYTMRRYKEKAYWLFLPLTIIGFFWLMDFAVLPLARYMVPAMGFVMIFTALFVELVLVSIWNKNSKN